MWTGKGAETNVKAKIAMNVLLLINRTSFEEQKGVRRFFL